MEHIVEFLRSMDEPEMADEVANAHNRLECYSTGITNKIIEQLRLVAERSLAELAAIKAENESLKKDAELWRGYQKRKQDLLDRGFLRSPLRADELDATAQGESNGHQ